jgi:hypothetical protein
MNRIGWLVWAALAGAGCSGSKAKPMAQDTLTTRQRQEREAALPLPGAAGIGRALKVQDSGAARAHAIDSVALEH